MKPVKWILLLFLNVLLFNACQEIPPTITPVIEIEGCQAADASAVADQGRQVLVEEFTGVRCVNCPAGSEELENLLGQYGEQLVAVSIHAGSFSPPYPESKYDFRTEAGDNILSFLGEPLGYPTAVVNRKKFEGEFDLQLSKSQWAGFIQNELQTPPQVKVHINPDYEADTGLASMDITLFIEENIEEDIALTVMVLEDGVEDYQETPDGKVSDYEHKHIFRNTITAYNGNLIQEATTAGEVICKSYAYTLDPTWIPENIEIVAFVSQVGGEKDVLQAAKIKLLP
jgi:hypothetical protein